MDTDASIGANIAASSMNATANNTPGTAVMSDFPHLPPEVWGNVLMDVDDPFDLWVLCRQVSKTFREEAQHAFRTKFLSRLRTEWFCYYQDTHSVYLRASLDSDLSDPTSATTYFSIISKGIWPRTAIEDPISDELRNEMIHHTLNYKDTGFRHRTESSTHHDSPLHVMHMEFEEPITLHGYVNDPELPELQIHLQTGGSENSEDPCKAGTEFGHISLNWKCLMSKFFAEEVYVRSRRPGAWKLEWAKETLERLMADAEASVSSQCDVLNWRLLKSPPMRVVLKADQRVYRAERQQFIQRINKTYAPNPDNLYAAAYENRLRKSYINACLDFDTTPSCGDNDTLTMDKFRIHTHVERLRKVKRGVIRNHAYELWNRSISYILTDSELDSQDYII